MCCSPKLAGAILTSKSQCSPGTNPDMGSYLWSTSGTIHWNSKQFLIFSDTDPWNSFLFAVSQYSFGSCDGDGECLPASFMAFWSCCFLKFLLSYVPLHMLFPFLTLLGSDFLNFHQPSCKSRLKMVLLSLTRPASAFRKALCSPFISLSTVVISIISMIIC